MFQTRYPKSPLLKKSDSLVQFLSFPTVDVKTYEEVLIEKNVMSLFKLSDSRVLIYEGTVNEGELEDVEQLVYIFDLNTSKKTRVQCNHLCFTDEKFEIRIIEFSYIAACLEVTPNCFILQLYVNACPYSSTYDCLITPYSHIPRVLNKGPDLAFGRTAVLRPGLLASLRYSEKTYSESLELFEFVEDHKALMLIESVDFKKRYCSVTAVDADTFILGGEKSDVDVYQIKGRQLILLESLTSKLACLPNPARAKAGKGAPLFVKMIGKNRDILLVVEKAYQEPFGLLSTWRWDAKKKQFEFIASNNKHTFYNLQGLMEYEDGEHFVLLCDGEPILIFNTALYSAEFPHQVRYSKFFDFPGGCALRLSNEKLIKWQLDYRALIKSEVEQCTPLHTGAGHLSRYIAEYACIGDADEKEAFQVARRMP